MKFKVPLNEIITDLFDSLKSITKGYGSMDYEVVAYEVFLINIRKLISKV